MRTLDDGVLFLIGANFCAEIFDDGIRRDSQCVCNVIQVSDVSLYTIET